MGKEIFEWEFKVRLTAKSWQYLRAATLDEAENKLQDMLNQIQEIGLLDANIELEYKNTSYA